LTARRTVELKTIRLSHRELAVCLANPRRWAAQRQSGAKGFVARPGYNAYLKYAMRRLDQGQTLAGASSYFMDATGRLVNSGKKDERLAWLASYHHWRKSAGIVGSDWFARPLVAVGNVVLGGQVDRVDFLQGDVSYRGILLSESGPSPGWRDELAYPLLQYGLATRYGRPVEEFGVGLQRLDGSQPEVTVYSPKELEAAVTAFQRLAKRISQYMV
jgi:hypothetical protein